MLKFHSKAAEKLKDMKDICVDFHPTYASTRCFIIIRNDGTREDVSIAKCVEKIKEKTKDSK